MLARDSEVGESWTVTIDFKEVLPFFFGQNLGFVGSAFCCNNDNTVCIITIAGIKQKHTDPKHQQSVAFRLNWTLADALTRSRVLLLRAAYSASHLAEALRARHDIVSIVPQPSAKPRPACQDSGPGAPAGLPQSSQHWPSRAVLPDTGPGGCQRWRRCERSTARSGSGSSDRKSVV